MNLYVDRARKIFTSLTRQLESFVNALRFGFVFVRVRWFKMPGKVRFAGKQVTLHYPQETGIRNDFFACIVRNDYGLRRGLLEVRTILDIGANVGFFSIAARARYPHAAIHAYEPNPRVLPFLQSNLSDLGVRIYPEAVGAESGLAKILDDSETNQARACVAEAGDIPLTGFGTAIQRMGGSVDLLKLDCEGGEWDLFPLTDAWRQIRNVRMEYHLFRGETVSQVEQALQKLGFTVTRLRQQQGFGMIWATAVEAPDEGRVATQRRNL